MNNTAIQQNIKILKVCVLIHVYNNEHTLKKVIDDVLNITEELLIINDGSTNTISEILKEYPKVKKIILPKNKGRGYALRYGFKKAAALGYDFAITIDNDRQYYLEDIPVFISKLESENNKNLLLIGTQNMEQKMVSVKNSFKNKISNFLFRVETSVKLIDTQSGYRLYPLKALNKIKFYTNNFEFETENIVRAAWDGVTIKNVYVRVFINENKQDLSIRFYKGFIRKSLLNTWLVLVAFLYIKPRDLIRKFKKKGLRGFIKEEILASNDTSLKKAQAMALGVFIGLSPFWGFHTIAVISLAVFFKLNKVISFAFTNVSFPLFIPFIVFFSIKIGSAILGETSNISFQDFNQNFEFTKNLKAYIIGSFIFATTTSISIGAISYFLLSLYDKKKK